MTAIRVVGGLHAPALAAVHAAAFDAGERWSAAAIASLLAMPGTWALVASGATGMAMVRVAADEAELLTLAVRPDARRQGIAARLVDAGAERAARQGARTLFLEVSTRNAPALALYAQAGFLRTGVRRRYYADGADAVLMALALERRLPPCGSAAS